MALAQVRTRRGRVTVYLLALGFAAVSGFPFLWAGLTMFRQDSDLYVTTHNPFVLAKPATLGHIADLLANTPYLRFIVNNILIGLVTVGITLLLSLPAAYSLARLSGRWGEKVGIGIFVTYLVPPTLLFLPLSRLITTVGLQDSIWSLAIVYPGFTIPLSTWLLMGFFKSIPRDIEEQAQVDGYSRIGSVVRTVLPLALPGIFTVVVFTFTLTMQDFIYALAFVSSSSHMTVSVGVPTVLIRGDVFYWQSLMAAAIIIAVPVALLYNLFLDRFIRGFTMGAVKG
jgi:multiple sugar transport system permease protein